MDLHRHSNSYKQNNHNNNFHSGQLSYVLSGISDSNTTHDSSTNPPPIHPPTGPYPSPPLSGSALRHTVSLPPQLDHKLSQYPQQEMQFQQPPFPSIPLSPPQTDPLSLFDLPLNNAHLPSPDMDCDPDDPYRSNSAAFRLQTPLTPANWLMVGPSDQEELSWEDDRSIPQPLSSEPTRSVWSPESPQHNDELEIDSDSCSSSSWGSELLQDQVSSWDQHWSSSMEWAPTRGGVHDDDYPMDNFCLDPLLSSYDYHSCEPSDTEFRPFIDFPMDDQSSDEDYGLLDSPASPLPCSALLPDSELDELAPPTPPRRTLLPDLGGERDMGLFDHSPPPPRILTLPGAESTDDDLLTSNLTLEYPLPKLDITSPLQAHAPDCDTYTGLGIFIEFPSPSTSAGSPSPEYTNIRDLYSEFPELEGYPFPIPGDLPLSPNDPDYDLVRLVQLCRKSKDAERKARKQEAELGQLFASISRDLLPPQKLDEFEKRSRLQQLQMCVERRGEERKTRKREKERCKEIRTLLRLKMEERAISGDAACQDVVGDAEGLGKKWQMNDMGQLVAKMVFRRREMFRPLAGRKMARVDKKYLRSPLSKPVDATTDEDENMDTTQGITPLQLEVPLIFD